MVDSSLVQFSLDPWFCSGPACVCPYYTVELKLLLVNSCFCSIYKPNVTLVLMGHLHGNSMVKVQGPDSQQTWNLLDLNSSPGPEEHSC